jgi:hypothetical protein
LPNSGGVFKGCIYVAVSSEYSVNKAIMTDKEKKLIDKISLKKCKEVLSSRGENYSDEEIIEIRNYLFELAQIDYEVFVYKQNKEEVREKEFEKIENEESINYKNAA